ncbi:TRADD-N-associated membrane domain-containing protein [Rhizobium sp. CC-YZS058]|uniref:TRADD-N-associated membrane domain-containing protein n=1 Tax=Rhizobium sp. CC-YZS058 TaxID=3042153 RepID=UPI002B056180|nr:hypothetical protein [Rhizobium sp. CC-YZS058]MEA3536629.1 hypothetical protein [Rhizobium sp. CC-YZS058]
MSSGRLTPSTEIVLQLLAETTGGLTASAFSGFGNLFRDRPIARWVVGILSGLWLVFALVTGVYVKAGPIMFIGRPMNFETILPLLLFPSVVAIFLLLAVLASLEKVKDGEIKLERLLRESREASQNFQDIGPLEEQKAKVFDILDVIQSNLDQLIDYYIINKAQATTSFRSSIIAISIGFATIIIGVWLAYAQAGDNTAAYISVLAGIVLQFIGGAFFFLYSKSLIQLNFFFARLALMQDTMLGIRLADSIPEGKDKHQILERLIFAIVQRNAIAPDYLSADKPRAPRTPRTNKAKPTAQVAE